MTWTAGQAAQTYFNTHNTFVVYVDGGGLRSSEAGGVEALRQIAAGQVTFVPAGRSRSDQRPPPPFARLSWSSNEDSGARDPGGVSGSAAGAGAAPNVLRPLDPEVHEDGTVLFRLQAPAATRVGVYVDTMAK